MSQILMKFIDQLPYILLGFAALLSAVSYLVSVRAKSNPEKTWEDDWAPVLANAKDGFIQAIEWLGTIKGWKGQEKLSQLLKQTNELEILWSSGKKTEAIMRAAAFYYDAEGKAKTAGLLAAGKIQNEINKAIPFSTLPLVGSPTVGASGSR